MAVKAGEVANWFIAKAAESGDVVTHLKVQKLIYYAEAWSQALENRSLVREEFQAWAHGPVVPEVFQAFKEHGWRPLPISAEQRLPDVGDGHESILEEVYEAYGDLPAKTLEDMTHRDQPWIDARGTRSEEERCEEVIPKDSIRAFYKEKYKV